VVSLFKRSIAANHFEEMIARDMVCEKNRDQGHGGIRCQFCLKTYWMTILGSKTSIPNFCTKKIVVAIAIAIAGEFKDSNNFGGFVVFSRGIPT